MGEGKVTIMRRYREEETEMLEDEQMFGRSKKALEIIDQSETDEDALEALFDEFVPATGIADTVGGGIVRSINRIVYRWFNDGDQVGFDYGVETVNSSYEYLIEKDIIIDKFDDYLYDSESNFSSDDYDEFLDQLVRQVVDTLHNRPELFDEKNEDNSRSGYTYSVEESTELRADAEEDEDSDWYFYHGDDEEESDEDEASAGYFGESKKTLSEFKESRVPLQYATSADLIPDYAKGKVQPPCFIYETRAVPNYASPLRKYCKELGYPVIDFFNKGTYFVQFNTNTELKSFVQKVKNHEFGYFDSWTSVGRDEDEE